MSWIKVKLTLGLQTAAVGKQLYECEHNPHIEEEENKIYTRG